MTESLATGGPADDAAEIRERLRAAIRREIARHDPTDDARQPLELIVESSLRYSEKDGALSVTALDAAGNPLAGGEGDAGAEAAIVAVLAELRRTRPALFKAAAVPDDTSGRDGLAADGPVPERDWLDVGSPDAPPAQGAAAQTAGTRPWPAFGAWFHRQMPRWRTAAFHGAERLDALRRRLPETLRGAGGTARAFLNRLPPGGFANRRLALGAAAALVLAAIAIYGIARTGSPAGEPGQTGSVGEEAAANRASLRGVPEVIDTSTLSVKGQVVHLYGVEWAPGGGKPEDLARYLAGREVACEPVGGTNAHRCRVDGKDLSTVVLYNGGGKATPEATEEMKAAAERARQARIGVWNR